MRAEGSCFWWAVPIEIAATAPRPARPSSTKSETKSSASASVVSTAAQEAEETAAETRAEAAKGDGQAARLLAKQAEAQKTTAAHTGVGRNLDSHA